MSLFVATSRLDVAHAFSVLFRAFQPDIFESIVNSSPGQFTGPTEGQDFDRASTRPAAESIETPVVTASPCDAVKLIRFRLSVPSLRVPLFRCLAGPTRDGIVLR